MAVFGGWGCGFCVHCKGGDEEMCIMPKWPGLSQYRRRFFGVSVSTVLQISGKA